MDGGKPDRVSDCSATVKGADYACSTVHVDSLGTKDGVEEQQALSRLFLRGREAAEGDQLLLLPFELRRPERKARHRVSNVQPMRRHTRAFEQVLTSLGSMWEVWLQMR